MLVGLLADIHGNAAALEAVLRQAKRMGIERLLIAGDLVGYYFETVRVLELLEPWPRDAVRGNHEEMLESASRDISVRSAVAERYGKGLESALATLDPQQLQSLAELPHPLALRQDGIRILLCHGSPWDLNQYLYPDADRSLLARCAASDVDLVVLGHTHYPMRHKIGGTLIINPGSVGQPRDRKPGAAWAVLNTETREVEFRRETYDIRALAELVKALDSKTPYLSEVLIRQ